MAQGYGREVVRCGLKSEYEPVNIKVLTRKQNTDSSKNTQSHVCVCAHMHAHVYKSTLLCVHVYTHGCLYVHAYAHIC